MDTNAEIKKLLDNGDTNSAIDLWAKSIVEGDYRFLAKRLSIALTICEKSRSIYDLKWVTILALREWDDPGNPEKTKAIFLSKATSLFSKFGEHRWAVTIGKRLSKTNPEDVVAQTTYTNALFRSGNKEELIDQLNKINKQFSSNFVTKTIVGIVLLHYKNYQKAYQFLSQALQLNPNNYPARILRAEANFRLKNYTDAFIDCIQALNLDVTETALNLVIRIGKASPSLTDNATKVICAVVEDTKARDDLLKKLRKIENDDDSPKSIGISSIYSSDYYLHPVDRVAFAVSRNRRALIAIIESINPASQ